MCCYILITLISQRNLNSEVVLCGCAGAEKRLYWCDSAKQTIESVKLDGTDRRVDHFINTLSTLSQPYSVASVGKYLFYSDWSGYLPGIQRHAKDNSGDSSLGDDIIVGLKTLAYFDSSLAAGEWLSYITAACMQMSSVEYLVARCALIV